LSSCKYFKEFMFVIFLHPLKFNNFKCINLLIQLISVSLKQPLISMYSKLINVIIGDISVNFKQPSIVIFIKFINSDIGLISIRIAELILIFLLHIKPCIELILLFFFILSNK
jgi:hypothetical protein